MVQIDISTKKYPNTFTLVDDEDYEYLNQWKWYFSESPSSNCVKRYSNIIIHRVIMNCSGNIQIDHINHDTLDNRKCNLRKCNAKENVRNRTLNKNSSTGYKGVFFNKRRNMFQSYITVDYKHKYLGAFILSIDAAITYNKAATKYFGEFAYLNEF